MADIALIVVLATLIVLLLVNAPVYVALGASGSVGIFMLRGPDVVMGLLGNTPYTATSSYSLTVIPMYLLLGLFVFHALIAQRVYALAHRAFRWLPGGIGIATVSACAGFAAVSGSSVATAAIIGRVSIGEMRSRGYPAAFAASLVAMSGTLGILIPPSVIMVVYAITTEQSVGRLLVAGIVPGVLSALVFSAYIMFRARIGLGKRYPPIERPQGGLAKVLNEVAPAESTRRGADGFTWPQLIRSGVWIALIFVIILAGVFSGLFTITESAGVGALAAFGILIVESVKQGPRALFKKISEALRETAATTSMTFLVLVGASIFSFFLVLIRVPSRVAEWITSVDMPPLAVLIAMLLAVVPLGMFLDALSVTIVAAPILAPIAEQIGFSPVVFAVLFVILVEIGLVTPPVGMNVYVISGVAKISADRIFLAVIPWIGLQVVVIAILIAVPELTLWLPEWIVGN